MRRSILVRLYPARWRRRYGDEFSALLEEEPWSVRLLLDILAGAFAAHLDPYPVLALEDRAMTSRRIEYASAIAALVLVLPALVLLASAAVRGLQPAQHEPARTASAIFEWFAALHAPQLVLVVGPLLALGLGALAVGRLLADDGALREDLGVLIDVGGRLLRRPAFVIGVFAVVGSLAVLAFAVGHAIAG
jgi:hypothetical protein